MVNRVAEFFSEAANERGQQLPKWDRLPELIRPVEQTIINNPGLAVAVAFAVGVTLACLIKRR